MIDNTVPNFSVNMVKHDMNTYPRYDLPEGFVITGYRDGYENAWAEIAKEQFLFESLEKGLQLFRSEFSSTDRWASMKDSCLFAVEEATGTVAAVLTLWEGGIFAEDYRRIHWVAAREAYQGKGIIKAMLTYAMDLYHSQRSEGPCILATGSPNWQAIRLYKRFGFEPYLGGSPAPYADFDLEKEKEKWALIDEKIAEFDKRKQA